MTNIAPLAITMGDASGIGPEIVAKTLAKGGERARSSAAASSWRTSCAVWAST